MHNIIHCSTVLINTIMKAAIEEIQDKKEGPTVCLSIIMYKPPCSTWPILTFVSIHVVGDL